MPTLENGRHRHWAGLPPVCPAYRPALLTGLPAYQPALLTLCDVRRRGGRAGWAVLIRLRAAPVE